MKSKSFGMKERLVMIAVAKDPEMKASDRSMIDLRLWTSSK